MERLSTVLGLLDGEPAIWCPACKCAHRFDVNAPNPHNGARWQWNGNAQAPTFTPSMHVVAYPGDYDDDGKWVTTGPPRTVCHSLVTEGCIQFVTDCPHAMAGQTVPLPEYPVQDE